MKTAALTLPLPMIMNRMRPRGVTAEIRLMPWRAPVVWTTGVPPFAPRCARRDGSVVTSDAGLLAYRKLDDALGLTTPAGEMLADARTGKNGRHDLLGLLRQSVFGRLAGYEDVNDAERLRHDPAMRWIVGGKSVQNSAASPSQMGRFETRWLTTDENLSALADLSGQWIDRVHGRCILSQEGDRAKSGAPGAAMQCVRRRDQPLLRGRTPVRNDNFQCLLKPLKSAILKSLGQSY